jgi:AcrR family transcriptional regulator
MKAVVWACWAQVGVEMADAADAVKGRPPLDRLEAQLGAYVRYAMQRPSRYQLLFALQLGADVDLDGPLRPAYRPVFETIEAHVADGGRLPTLDPESAAVFTLSFVHGRIALAHLAPTRPGNGPALVESAVRETIRPLFTSPGR